MLADEVVRELQELADRADALNPLAIDDGNRYGKSWLTGLARDARMIATLVTSGHTATRDAEADLVTLKLDLDDCIKDFKQRFGLVDEDKDSCSCSARDLLTFGHKCGRKAPIDKI